MKHPSAKMLRVSARMGWGSRGFIPAHQKINLDRKAFGGGIDPVEEPLHDHNDQEMGYGGLPDDQNEIPEQESLKRAPPTTISNPPDVMTEWYGRRSMKQVMAKAAAEQGGQEQVAPMDNEMFPSTDALLTSGASPKSINQRENLDLNAEAKIPAEPVAPFETAPGGPGHMRDLGGPNEYDDNPRSVIGGYADDVALRGDPALGQLVQQNMGKRRPAPQPDPSAVPTDPAYKDWAHTTIKGQPSAPAAQPSQPGLENTVVRPATQPGGLPPQAMQPIQQIEQGVKQLQQLANPSQGRSAMAVYPGNLGFEEMMRFYREASVDAIEAMDHAVEAGNELEVRALFREHLGVTLVAGKMTCEWCKEAATMKVLWAEGKAFIPSCDAHEAKTRKHIASECEKMFGTTEGTGANDDGVDGIKRIAKFWRRAGKAKRQRTYMGVTCKIEYNKGDYKEGVNKKTGEAWQREMHASYGYIPRTKGADGEAVDVYLNEQGGEQPYVYIIHQKTEEGKFDEHKAMLGFKDADEASECYKQHVPEWCFGHCETMTMDHFKNVWLRQRRRGGYSGRPDKKK